jgi:hypothetical protein
LIGYAQYIDLQCTSPANAPFAKLGRPMSFAMPVLRRLADLKTDANCVRANRSQSTAAIAFNIHPL